jgi:hypothetical protein
LDYKDNAQKGLLFMKESILALLKNHPEGLNNSEIAKKLDISSDYQGGNKDYLSWSLLGLLLNEKKIKREGRKYYINY